MERTGRGPAIAIARLQSCELLYVGRVPLGVLRSPWRGVAGGIGHRLRRRTRRRRRGTDWRRRSGTSPKCLPTSSVFEGNSCATSGLACPSIQGVARLRRRRTEPQLLLRRQQLDVRASAPPVCDYAGPAERVPRSLLHLLRACRARRQGSPARRRSPSYGCGSTPSSTMESCTCTTSGWSCPPIAEPPCVSPPPTALPEPVQRVPVRRTATRSRARSALATRKTAAGRSTTTPSSARGSWLPVATTTCAIYPDYDGGYYEDASFAYPAEAGVPSPTTPARPSDRGTRDCSRPLRSAGRRAKTGTVVVVDQAACLHERVDDRRADEAESLLDRGPC